jgi:hypothetical protein
MASSRSGTSSTLAVLKLTRRCSKNRRHDFLEAGPDLRRRAFLYHDGAGHSRANQHAGWHVRDVDPDRNALRQSHPGECVIDGSEIFAWCLESDLKLVMQMTLMSIGLYSEPAGAWLPSVLL